MRWSRCWSYSLLLCGLFYEAICFMPFLVLFCSCVFSVLLALRLPRLGMRKLILVVFVRLFALCLFGFVGFLFLLVSGKGCGLWLWHSLDFSLTFFCQRYLSSVLFRGCLIVFVCLFLWCWELDVALILYQSLNSLFYFKLPTVRTTEVQILWAYILSYWVAIDRSQLRNLTRIRRWPIEGLI